MAILKINELAPGMTLTEEVRGANGRFLVGAGAVLTEKHLRVMKLWGVVEAAVAETEGRQDGEPEPALDPRLGKLCEERVDDLFTLADKTESAEGNTLAPDHPAMVELRLLSRDHCARLAEAEGERGLDSRARNFLGSSGRGKAACLPRPTGAPTSAEEMIKRSEAFVTLPAVYLEITRIIENPLASAAHLAEAVSRDPGFAAKLLRLVNSAMYGLRGKVDSIARAVTIVGTRELSNLALGIAVMDSFGDVDSKFMSVRDFWVHSLGCGILARLFAAQLPGHEQERLFVTGLLHDMGRLLLFKMEPMPMAQAVASAYSQDRPLIELERECFGFDHVDVTQGLVAAWNLPESLTYPILHSHESGSGEGHLDTALIHLADTLAVVLGYGFSGQEQVPALDSTAWNTLGFSPNVLSMVARQSERQLHDVVSVLLDHD